MPKAYWGGGGGLSGDLSALVLTGKTQLLADV